MKRFYLLLLIIGLGMCNAVTALPYNPWKLAITLAWQDKLAQATHTVQKDGWLLQILITTMNTQRNPSIAHYEARNCLDLHWYHPKKRLALIKQLQNLLDTYTQARNSAQKQKASDAIGTYAKNYASKHSPIVMQLQKQAQRKPLRRTYVYYAAPAATFAAATLCGLAIGSGYILHTYLHPAKTIAPIIPIKIPTDPIQKNKKRIIHQVTKDDILAKKAFKTFKPSVWRITVNGKEIPMGGYCDIDTDTVTIIHESAFPWPVNKKGKREIVYKLPTGTNQASILFHAWDPEQKNPVIKLEPGILERHKKLNDKITSEHANAYNKGRSKEKK